MTDKLSLEAIFPSPPGANFPEPLILRASPLIVSESSSEDSSCTSGDSCAASLPSQAEADDIRLSDDKQVREDSPSQDQEFEAPPLPDDELEDDEDLESASEPAQPMQEGGSRKRIPTQRLKSSQLLQSSRVPNEGDDDELPQQRLTPKKAKVKIGSKDSLSVQNIDDMQPGDIMEMFESVRKLWLRIRVTDVKDKKVHVRQAKKPKSADDHDSSSSPPEGRWMEFKKGLFRRLQGESRATKEVQRKKSSAPKTAPVAATTKPAKKPKDDTRRKPTSGGEAESAPSKSKATSSKSKEAVMKQAMKIRKPTKESKDKDKKGKTKSGSKESPPKKSSKQAPTKRLSKGSQDGEQSAAAGSTSGSEGESPAAAVVTGNQRRDWGLMHVDVVGRNRPPFARTLLFHGPIQVCSLPPAFFLPHV
jgi:hypothetical protein